MNPKIWEQKYGLDPRVPDGSEDRDGDGYTNVEEYLNSITGYLPPEPTQCSEGIITSTCVSLRIGEFPRVVGFRLNSFKSRDNSCVV